MTISTKTIELRDYNDNQLRKLYIYNEGDDTVQRFFTEFTNYLVEHNLKIEIYFNNTRSAHLFNIFVLPASVKRAGQARYQHRLDYIAHMETTGPWVKTEKSALFRRFVQLFEEVKEYVEEG